MQTITEIIADLSDDMDWLINEPSKQTMKTILTTGDIAKALIHDENANWSRAGAFALAEYLEQLEEECSPLTIGGLEMELDIIALRCEYSEYDSAITAASCYTPEFSTEKDAIEYLEDHTSVIQFEGGVIIQDF